MKTFADYLTDLRAQAITGAVGSGAPTNAEVLTLMQTEFIKRHGSAVKYEYLGDDSNGAPVYRLGTAILLQDIGTQILANLAAGSVKQVAGGPSAYSLNLSLR